MGKIAKKFIFFLVLAILAFGILSFIESGIFAPYKEEIIDRARNLPFFSPSIYKPTRDEAPPEIVIITLKNEGKITGVVQGENDDGVVVDVGFGTVTVSRGEVERIDVPTPAEKEAILAEWQGHTSQTQKPSRLEVKKNIDEYYKRIEENLKIKDEMAKRGIEIQYYGSEQNRIIVDAVLNGRVRTLMIVDTGATSVCITPEVANRLSGLSKDISKKTRIKWVDGSVTEATPAILASVKIGEARAENVGALISEMPAFFDSRINGLLGMSFLKKFHVTIDSGKNKLILEKK